MSNMMKLWAVVLLFGTMLFGVELHWEADTATASAKAKVENKQVMPIVEASRCRWCKKMKEETFADEEVNERLQRYLLVKVARCDKEEMNVLPESYYPAPSTFFITPDGEMIERAIGFLEAEECIASLNDVEAN